MYSVFYYADGSACCVAHNVPQLEVAVEMALSLHRFSNYEHKVTVLSPDGSTVINFFQEDAKVSGAFEK